MSQSATLYRIGKIDFPKIVDNPNDFKLFDSRKGYATFEKTHEGLTYVLSQEKNEVNVKLAEQVFYPISTIGEMKSLEDINFENLPDDFDFVKLDDEMNSLILYNTPDVVAAISRFLESTSVEEFVSRFNFEELNSEGIYPHGIWNDDQGEDIGFEVRDMKEEFARLKVFYHAAAKEDDYVLSFVG